MREIGKMLALFGGVIMILGLALWTGLGSGWLGRLPGDIRIERGNSAFYFPLVTCLIVSIVAQSDLRRFSVGNRVASAMSLASRRQQMLNQHVARLLQCRRCPRMLPPPVSGGPVLSKVMLVGQAPGVREPILGRPFAWTAGRTLFGWFEEFCHLSEAGGAFSDLLRRGLPLLSRKDSLGWRPRSGAR